MERRDWGKPGESQDGQAGAVALPAGGEPPGLPCANCGTRLTGPFCARCGQHVADYHRSVWRFVTDFLDNTFCWDNKLLLTLAPLFRQPGQLTAEFMVGRRVRYVHPLRLFLFTSAVCLAVLHYGGDTSKKHHGSNVKSKHATPSASVAPETGPRPLADSDDADRPPAAAPAASRSSALSPQAAAILARMTTSMDLPVPSASPDPSALPDVAPSPSASPAPSASSVATPTSKPDVHAAVAAAITDALQGKVDPNRAKKLEELGTVISNSIDEKNTDGRLERMSRQVTDDVRVRQRLSWMVLALLPVFALMLHALYRREDAYYFLHLVFSLHYHTFLLLFWTAYTWLSALLLHTFLHGLVTLLLLVPALYLFQAMRRVYGDGVYRTGIKTALLGGMHLLTIYIGLEAIGASGLF